jgi:hypothetical protein
MNKKAPFGVILAGILAIALIAGVFYYQNQKNANRPQSFEFHGSVDKIEGNTITASGVFMDKNNVPISEGGTNETKSMTSVQLKVSPDMRITRTALQLPSAEELRKTNGMFNVDDLKKTDSQVNLQAIVTDLSNGSVSIYAKSTKDIFGKSKFTPSELSYRVGVK